jgi:hypothetical protein
METRLIEYPRSNGLDYHHNSPLIGEIPTNDYTHFHRSIDQLRTLNERGILNANHFQSVLVPASTSPIIIQATTAYGEFKLNDETKVVTYQSPKIIHNRQNSVVIDHVMNSDEYEQNKCEKSENVEIQSPQQYSLMSNCASPNNMHTTIHQHNTFQVTMDAGDSPTILHSQEKSKVLIVVWKFSPLLLFCFIKKG